MSSPAGPVAPVRAAVLAGVLVWLVVAVDLARWIRPFLLLDSDPLWAAPRVALGLFVIAASAAAGGLAAGGFLLWSRSRLGEAAPAPLPFSGSALAALTLLALAIGIWLRFVALDRIPADLWVDDVSLISPALGLRGRPSDFADAIRPAPFGVAKPYGNVGVLYLEAFRGSLRIFGTGVFGVRFLSAAAGAASVATAFLLGRALLPAGGGALAALVLAGLRWGLLLSRWGWVAVAVGPILDVSGLCLLEARRRQSLVLAGVAGIAGGIGAHVYLSAWVGAVALAALALWPRIAGLSPPRRILLGLFFAAGFLAAASPLFLFRQGRVSPYFARVSDHNVLAEIRRERSPMPLLATVADSLAAPWLKSDPTPHHDLPGRAALGWILGIPVAVALACALSAPREDRSAFLLTHAGAALMASAMGGQAGVPNNFRFAYLATVTAVAASSGILSLLGLVAPAARRPWALASVGLVIICGALAARDALIVWPRERGTFDGFHGQDTLIARAMLRWQRYGAVSFDPAAAHSALAVEGVCRFRLDPDAPPLGRLLGATGRSFRVEMPRSVPRAGERIVERIQDDWGRDWAVVLGTRTLRREAAGSSG